ncbi:tetratricopeptide repeat protein [Herbidospora sp. NEAU-GS84]|uniref:Tetratricopeptide repeat protein n=1 Tax=Herbidospora solisilvae TaxID=2696284 RepID=A0A7C9NY28_9ACTN|nr:tetratricopeptide repeat protein [Herbidospora solisilvae]NAS20077.1 tetratricopeptide repeat protein [Herbidospora solisilvae]
MEGIGSDQDPGRDLGEGSSASIQMEATASGHGEVNQAGHNLTVNKTVNTVNTVNVHLPPPAPPVGQIVEGDIPRRPPAFQPRSGLLDALKAQVRQEGAAVIDAVTGTPGVGKSMLAASYAWTCQQVGWPLIVWINAQHPDQILTGLAGLARRLNLHDPDDDAQAAALKARNWLAAADRPGLLVFDNATAVDDVRPWCPATGEVQILITTRNRAFHTLFTAIDVGVFPPEQSVALLHQRTGDTTPGAEQVAAELGHLPLALGQAGAYIHRRRMTYSTYLTLLRDYPLHRQLPPQAHDDYPDGTAAAILLSIDQAEQTIPHAQDMLELLAVLSEAGVPRAVLYGTIDPDPAGTEGIDQLLADLADTSLVTFSEDGATVLMHRLTSRILRERAHHTTADAVGSRLAEMLDRGVYLLHRFNAHIPTSSAAWAARTAVDMLMEQTATLYALAADLDEPFESILFLRARCGQYLHDIADLTRAIPLLEQTLADFERVLGADHPSTLASRNNLASAYREAGDLGRAISLQEQTLADCERVLGGDHPDTLASRNNLAGSCRAAGDLTRAIALLERTLADRERVLGGDHPDTLVSRNNLAGAYEATGDLGRSIPLHKQTLADFERVLGGDHPSTLSSRNNLATAYQTAGNLSQAIPLLEQTLADRERVLGVDHPDTLTSRNNLAFAYQEAGDLGRAIPLHRQTLADRERVLSGDHPDILQSRNNLALAYVSAGDISRAIPLYEQVLTERERVLGVDHPDTLNSRNNLGGAYQVAGDLSRAIPLLEQALAHRERILGDDHPDTLFARNNLGGAYQAAGDLSRAIPLLQQTLADRERVLGGDHPHTLQSRTNFAHAHYMVGNLSQALTLFAQTLADCERVLGPDHPHTVISRANLAGVYQAAGDLGRAVPLFEQSLAQAERVLGADHPTTRVVRGHMRTALRQSDSDLD